MGGGPRIDLAIDKKEYLMQVHQIVGTSADVMTITRLSPGDVYKRVEESDYYSGAKLVFGVVQSVMNNGEDAAVTALEYEADYNSGAKAVIKVMTGSRPVAIFPATPEEVTAHLEELWASAQSAVIRAEDELQKKREALGAVERLRDGVGELTAPEMTAEVTR